ncbi:MAG: hypothetical protein ACFB21_01510 [Opitutales bacterium]
MRPDELTTGLVLGREARGERTVRLETLTPEGWLRPLKRVSAKGAGIVPDLFDTAEMRRSGRSHFLDEYRPVVRRPQISQRYAVFHHACQWAAFWVANIPLMEFDAALYDHGTKVADALAAGRRPATVVLKSLYWLARREGYAVNASWLGSLEPAFAEAAGHCLRQPLEVLPENELEGKALLDSLSQWLARQSDFTLPPAFGVAP